MEPSFSQIAALLAVAGIVLAAPSLHAELPEYSGGRGAPISIVVRDAPLAEVFEMLSRKEEVNILLGKDVEGEVSVNLYDVSLDYAIRAISDAAGFVAVIKECWINTWGMLLWQSTELRFHWKNMPPSPVKRR